MIKKGWTNPSKRSEIPKMVQKGGIYCRAAENWPCFVKNKLLLTP